MREPAAAAGGRPDADRGPHGSECAVPGHRATPARAGLRVRRGRRDATATIALSATATPRTGARRSRSSRAEALARHLDHAHRLPALDARRATSRSRPLELRALAPAGLRLVRSATPRCTRSSSSRSPAATAWSRRGRASSRHEVRAIIDAWAALPADGQAHRRASATRRRSSATPTASSARWRRRPAGPACAVPRSARSTATPPRWRRAARSDARADDRPDALLLRPRRASRWSAARSSTRTPATSRRVRGRSGPYLQREVERAMHVRLAGNRRCAEPRTRGARVRRAWDRGALAARRRRARGTTAVLRRGGARPRAAALQRRAAAHGPPSPGRRSDAARTAPCTDLRARAYRPCARSARRRRTPRTVALVGDSHAGHWRGALTSSPGARAGTGSRSRTRAARCRRRCATSRSRGARLPAMEARRVRAGSAPPEVATVFVAGSHRRLRRGARAGARAASTRPSRATSTPGGRCRRPCGHRRDPRHAEVPRRHRHCVERAAARPGARARACAISRRDALDRDPAIARPRGAPRRASRRST